LHHGDDLAGLGGNHRESENAVVTPADKRLHKALSFAGRLRPQNSAHRQPRDRAVMPRTEKISQTFSGAAIKYRVEKGRTEEAIIVNAAGVDGTLIAMATHGRSGLDRWLLGSITEKVVRDANNPVLAVRVTADTSSEGEAAMGSILVPLDGSTLAESVLPYVIELAKAFDAKVTLLRSYHLKEMIFSFEKYHPDLDQVRGALKWEAMSYLNEKVAELKSRGLVEICSSVSEGDAAQTIIEMGKATANTLIVMSPHSGSVLKRWVLGSVTEKVLRYSNSSVLTIRT